MIARQGHEKEAEVALVGAEQLKATGAMGECGGEFLELGAHGHVVELVGGAWVHEPAEDAACDYGLDHSFAELQVAVLGSGDEGDLALVAALDKGVGVFANEAGIASVGAYEDGSGFDWDVGADLGREDACDDRGCCMLLLLGVFIVLSAVFVFAGLLHRPHSLFVGSMQNISYGYIYGVTQVVT